MDRMKNQQLQGNPLTPDCGAKSSMRTSEAVRCKECGHRVMYKPRTHRSEFWVEHSGRLADWQLFVYHLNYLQPLTIQVQFEAR